MEACFSHKTTSTGKGFVALDEFRFRHRPAKPCRQDPRDFAAGLGVVEKLASGVRLWGGAAARYATGRPVESFHGS